MNAIPDFDPDPDIPTLEELEADPEIAALLDFEPVPRKVKRPDGWTPELQRAFILHLALFGSPTRAAEAMGKSPSGIDALYKARGAESFRAAWHQAIAIARARSEAPIELIPLGRPPGMGRVRKAPAQSLPAWDEAADDEPDMDEADKLELIQRLAVKFLKKVVAEREARLAGEVVAADFYLRQVTALEVIFDLLASPEVGGIGGGMDAWEHLKSLQRGGHNWARIVDTPFARMLDDKRREYWAESSRSVLGTDETDSGGEPMRPVAFDDEFLIDHGDHRTAVDQNGFGACTTPARGYSAAAWAAMDHDSQRLARQNQFSEDAAEQIRWEQRARAEFEERQRTQQ